MAEKLKDNYLTTSSISSFADVIKKHYSKFNKDKFIKLIFNGEWDSKELKERWRHVTISLHKMLPGNYKTALEILIEIAPLVKGMDAICLPDYVEIDGMDDWDLSLPALGHFTKYSTSEFAIRPFIIENPEKAMSYMSQWADDKNENIRRFASEGCRPRLPWAIAIPEFKNDPAPILPILDKLKNDKSEFVRRSVANNINDISKDHPDLVLEICEQWFGQSENTDWIVKHACRTLLKKGNKRALIIFGYHDPSEIEINELKIENNTVIIGDDLHYSFILKVSGEETSKVRLEYGLDFMKANGKQSRKVFKITENRYDPGTHSFSKKHSFADMSTRKHHEGRHDITVIVNGEEKATAGFDLKRA